MQEAPRKLSDVARNGDEFKAVVYLANSLVRALVSNAKEEVQDKLLSQFEAWFRFVLDAQKGHSGEQEDELQRLVEGWRKEEEVKLRQQGDELRKQEELRRQEELHKEQLRLEEELRQEEQLRQQEQVRRQEELRQEEEMRKQGELRQGWMVFYERHFILFVVAY